MDPSSSKKHLTGLLPFAQPALILCGIRIYVLMTLDHRQFWFLALTYDHLATSENLILVSLLFPTGSPYTFFWLILKPIALQDLSDFQDRGFQVYMGFSYLGNDIRKQGPAPPMGTHSDKEIIGNAQIRFDPSPRTSIHVLRYPDALWTNPFHGRGAVS